MTQALEAARDAYERHSWEEAYQALAPLGESGALEPDDLRRLADAAWWSGHAEAASDALEMAYLAYSNAGEKSAAAAVAISLAERATRAMEGAAGQAWLSRALRLLEDEPESSVHAWYEFMQAATALLGRRDAEAAIIHADRAGELGRAHGDVDVQALALSFKGVALTKLGRVEEGLALIDEAAVAATSGELTPKTACDVYCVTIAACRDVSDIGRSAEWTDRAERFMQRQSIDGYPGACKVHRAEIKRLHGRWAEAEEEAKSACEELEKFHMVDILGAAYNEIGEVRLRLGDLQGAEASFLKAFEYGADPQPGLARLHLARNDAGEAARSLERSFRGAVGAPGGDLVTRVRLLPARVEVAVALGDVEAARSATEELEELSDMHDNPLWKANAVTARGLFELAFGDISIAVQRLDAAWRSWQELDFPYESARARTALGRARRAEDDATGGRLELEAALAVYRRLGAAHDIGLVERLLDEGRTPSAGVVTRTFLFTDIVTSTDLIGLIGDAAWSDLIRWHDQTLQRIFATGGGEVVNHTGDGFFVAFQETVGAIDCAVEIQRTLHRHRQEHGFAPSIRIGVHRADAVGGDGGYTGRGVHVAARVGQLGDGEEIVVTADTIDDVAALPYGLSEARPVELKGVPDPIAVRNVDWR